NLTVLTSLFSAIKNSQLCKHKDYYVKDSCNACFCARKFWHCTDNIHCVPDKNKKPQIETECPLGQQFRVGACHRCYCMHLDGSYTCKREINCVTVTDCSKDKYWFPKVCQAAKTKSCEFADRLRLDACNYCVCNSGKVYTCTQIECSSAKITGRSGRCVEGHKYYLADSCNFCICQGGQEFCTSRPCLPNADGKYFFK
ncbi:von Willebrand factor C and EGF domain-containing protein-like, partial [Helicoverpa zea]|uniref:von Willebrand factor C and EGF domain-containing protein-like n=1 Tax=Helicoverpa zea TaxID=7113 RepID=UPI001F57CDA2